MSAAGSLFMREMRLAFRSKSDAALQLVFALLVTSLFPLALGPDAETLQKLGAALLILAVLFTQFLGFEKMFVGDAENGSLDIVAASRLSFTFYALIKMAARWVGYALPLLIISPLLALMLHVKPEAIPQTIAALALASLTITLAGTAAAALTLGSRSGFLLPLLLAPLCVPVVIFAAALAQQGFDGATGRQAALFLGSLFFLYLCFSPLLTGAALKSAVEAS